MLFNSGGAKLDVWPKTSHLTELLDWMCFNVLCFFGLIAFLLCLVSNVASVSGFFILDCSLGCL